MTDLRSTIKTDFRQKRIVIIGDLVADQFLNGTISRVSREAPVFILRHDRTETLAGAAGNAAANVASLGATPLLIGFAGNDTNGDLLVQKLDESGVGVSNILRDERQTTTKVRVLAGQHYAARQQVIRIDYENTAPLSDELKAGLLKNLASEAGTADAIIVSDYNCGAIFPEVFEMARERSTDLGIPLIVDSRFRLSEFTGATSATPNRDEVEKILGENFSVEDCRRLREKLGYRSLLVTNGNEGMLLLEENMPPVTIDAIGSKEPVDVTGAGDTVIAAYSLSLACGLSFENAARVANHAGGIVVMKKRTATVTPYELLRSLGADDNKDERPSNRAG